MDDSVDRYLVSLEAGAASDWRIDRVPERARLHHAREVRWNEPARWSRSRTSCLRCGASPGALPSNCSCMAGRSALETRLADVTRMGAAGVEPFLIVPERLIPSFQGLGVVDARNQPVREPGAGATSADPTRS